MEEFNVAFLLSRDDVVDQHGAFCGNGLMYCSSSGLANDEVMRAEEFWDFLGPALDMDTTGEGFFERPDLVIQAAHVSTKNDGYVAILAEGGLDDIVDVW